MDLQTLLQNMINKRASDLHIRAGGPAYIRVEGDLRPVSPEPIPAADAEAMLNSIMTKRVQKLWQERGEVDFGFQAGEVARFRVNAFKQRQRLAIAIRFIPTTMPTFQELRLPVATMKQISDNSRGLILVTGITG